MTDSYRTDLEIFLPVGAHSVDHGVERLSLLGECVFHTLRPRIFAAPDHSFMLQLLKLVCEGARTDPAQRYFKLREALWGSKQVAHDEQGA